MAEKIIGCLVACLVSGAFFLVSMMGNDREPVTFFSDDTSLKDKVRDIPAYNREMKRTYRLYAYVYLLAGVLFMINSLYGFVLMGVNITAGLLCVYLCYRKILKRYS